MSSYLKFKGLLHLQRTVWLQQIEIYFPLRGRLVPHVPAVTSQSNAWLPCRPGAWQHCNMQTDLRQRSWCSCPGTQTQRRAAHCAATLWNRHKHQHHRGVEESEVNLDILGKMCNQRQHNGSLPLTYLYNSPTITWNMKTFSKPEVGPYM